jgi:hypothetical protein
VPNQNVIALAYGRSPVITMSTSRPPQREHTNRSPLEAWNACVGAIGGQQNNARPPVMLLWTIPVRHHRAETSPVTTIPLRIPQTRTACPRRESSGRPSRKLVVLRQIIGDLEPGCLAANVDMPLRANAGVVIECSEGNAEFGDGPRIG